MNTDLSNYIKNIHQEEWTPLLEAGVDTSGLFVKALRRDEQGRAPSFIAKFEPGANYPYHNHPKGEEILVLEGACEIEGKLLRQGDYLYTPPGFKHSVRSDEGCILFFIVPQEVEII